MYRPSLEERSISLSNLLSMMRATAGAGAGELEDMVGNGSNGSGSCFRGRSGNRNEGRS